MISLLLPVLLSVTGCAALIQTVTPGPSPFRPAAPTPSAPGAGHILTIEPLALRLRAPASWAVLSHPGATEIWLGPSQDDLMLTIRTLDFAGRGDTFLAAIEKTVQAQPPRERRYLLDADGRPQGELLVFAERLIGFLQQGDGDASTALQMEGPNTPDVQAAMASAAFNGDGQAPAADVVVEHVEARQTTEGAWTFDVRLRHPDTGWDDYADGWQVVTPDGRVLGTRILLHPHVQEQPFTRSLGGVAIPASVAEVRIVAHDLVSGYGGESRLIPLGAAGGGEGYRVLR